MRCNTPTVGELVGYRDAMGWIAARVTAVTFWDLVDLVVLSTGLEVKNVRRELASTLTDIAESHELGRWRRYL